MCKWTMTKETKLYALGQLTLPQEELKKFLQDDDPEIRSLAARHPGVNPLDLIQALKEYPELRLASPQAFFMAEWMRQKNTTVR